MILAGRVYAAVPPLYSIKLKGGKLQYFTDRLAFIQYIQGRFSKENVVKNAVTSQIYHSSDMIRILFNNADFADKLDIVSNTYAINPNLLETCIRYRNIDYNKFVKLIKKEYRFLNVYQKEGVTILDGLVEDKYNSDNDKYHTVIFNAKLVNACESLFKYIDSTENEFILNDTKVSLYELMRAFNKFKPANVQRYKGLGEMNDNELSESTLHPDADRTLYRYTTENIKAEIEAIRDIENEKAKLLKDVDMASFEF